MFNHLEYDASTLKAEYERDRAAGKAVALPHNTFPDDDPLKAGSLHQGDRSFATDLTAWHRSRHYAGLRTTARAASRSDSRRETSRSSTSRPRGVTEELPG